MPVDPDRIERFHRLAVDEYLFPFAGVWVDRTRIPFVDYDWSCVLPALAETGLEPDLVVGPSPGVGTGWLCWFRILGDAEIRLVIKAGDL
jgi:hypothetical protein